MVRAAVLFALAAGLINACSSPSALDTVAATRAQARTTSDSAEMLSEQGTILIATNDFSTQERMRALARQQNLAVLTTYTPYQGSTARIYGSTALGCIAGAVPVSERKL